MAKKKLSPFNLRMRSLLKAGVPFASAARRASKNKRLKTVKANTVSMARKRRRRFSAAPRRTRRRSMGGMGSANGLVNMLVRAGTGYAAGAGTKVILDQIGMYSNVSQISRFSPFIAAYAGLKAAGGGLPGIAAAAPFVLSTGFLGNSSEKAVTLNNGMGAFV